MDFTNLNLYYTNTNYNLKISKIGIIFHPHRLRNIPIHLLPPLSHPSLMIAFYSKLYNPKGMLCFPGHRKLGRIDWTSFDLALKRSSTLTWDMDRVEEIGGQPQFKKLGQPFRE